MSDLGRAERAYYTPRDESDVPLTECGSCDGSGICDCCQASCEECDGTGKVEDRLCDPGCGNYTQFCSCDDGGYDD